jgi:hypothetical protein
VKALAAYADHPDPTTRLCNSIALLVGANGPFYPLYVWWLVPEAGFASLTTMAASPGFLAIPWLARHRPCLARAALPLLGLANTLWTVALLGPATAAAAFVAPCLMLAGLSWRTPRALLALLGTSLAVLLAALNWPLSPLAGLDPAQHAALASMNTISAAALLAYAVIVAARAMRGG